MSENKVKDGVMMLSDDEFSSFELQPVDKEAFCKTLLKVPEYKENGIPVVVEGVRPVKEKTIKGKKKWGFSLKLQPQEPIEKALGKEIVEKEVKDKKTGEMVVRKVYDDVDEAGDKKPLIKIKDYDKPIHVPLNFSGVKEVSVEESEKYPDGIMKMYTVSTLGSAFPLLNCFLQGAGIVNEGNKQPFAVNQDNLNDLEGFEFVANAELVKLEGLKPFLRILASPIDLDFDNISDNDDSKEKSKSDDPDDEW